MSVTVRGATETKAVLRKVEAFLGSTKPMKKTVEDIKERIEDRTASGKDYKGRKFEPYSPGYAKKKKGKVNLKVTGEMLRALTARVLNPRHGRIEIKGRRELIANIHTTGTGKQPQREFMNITKSGQAKIVKKHWDDPILKILGRGK